MYKAISTPPKCSCRFMSLPQQIRRKSSKLAFRIEKRDMSTKQVCDHKPPLPVRIALVSTSTALCTPIFPAIGFINACLRVMVPDPNLRYKLSGSVGTITNIAFYYIVPFSYQYSPMLLPFAIGNGICAGAGYAVFDVASGGPTSKMMKNPLITGGGIGAMTGLVAPPLLYGKLYSLLYGVEGIDGIIQKTFTTIPICAQISCATGFAAGVAMFPMLHYPIHGLHGIHWSYFSGLMLLASGFTTYYLYSPIKEMPMENGAFVNPRDVPLLDSIVRYNVKTGVCDTFSLSTGEWLGSLEAKKIGQRLSEAVRVYQQSSMLEKRHTFDNQILSLLCRWLDNDIARRFPDNVVTVRGDSELKKVEDMMLQTDWTVALLTGSNNIQLGEESLRTGLNDKISSMKMQDISMDAKKLRRRLISIETTSLGVKLLMAHRIQSNGGKPCLQRFERTTLPSKIDIERWVRKRAPGIVLYKEDEEEGLRGQSVESQLISLAWNAQDVESSLDQWEKIANSEKRRKLWTGIVLTSGISLFLAGMPFIS